MLCHAGGEDSICRCRSGTTQPQESLGHVIVFSQVGNSSRGSCKNLFVITLEAQGHSSGSLSEQLTDVRQSAGHFFMFLMTKQVGDSEKKGETLASGKWELG